MGNLPVGAEVTARVIDIDFATMRLILSSKSGILQQVSKWEHRYLAENDPFYRALTDREIQEIEAAKRVRPRADISLTLLSLQPLRCAG